MDPAYANYHVPRGFLYEEKDPRTAEKEAAETRKRKS